MWGSNPRHALPKIRFRNLLYFSRLTNQFTIIFAPIWDNFGTLSEILGKGFGERFFLIGFFLSCSWLACFDLIFQQLTGLCPIEECFW